MDQENFQIFQNQEKFDKERPRKINKSGPRGNFQTSQISLPFRQHFPNKSILTVPK